jgi:hypothetical protein
MLPRAAQRLPARRSRHAPAKDLGNSALPGNKARVARVEVPCNAEFPRYGHGCRAVPRGANREVSPACGLCHVGHISVLAPLEHLVLVEGAEIGLDHYEPPGQRMVYCGAALNSP